MIISKEDCKIIDRVVIQNSLHIGDFLQEKGYSYYYVILGITIGFEDISVALELKEIYSNSIIVVSLLLIEKYFVKVAPILEIKELVTIETYKKETFNTAINNVKLRTMVKVGSILGEFTNKRYSLVLDILDDNLLTVKVFTTEDNVTDYVEQMIALGDNLHTKVYYDELGSFIGSTGRTHIGYYKDLESLNKVIIKEKLLGRL